MLGFLIGLFLGITIMCMLIAGDDSRG